MMLRVVKLPVVAGACLIAGILIGAALTPVLAQQLAGPDGQVAVRSDYAVYLIANGQRRWVATVMITDQEINALPEGEPIFAGLTPLAGAAASSAPPTSVPPPTPTAIPAPIPPQPNPPAGNQGPAAPPAANPGQYPPTANQPPVNQPPVNPQPNLTPPGPLPSGSIGSSGSQSPANPAPQVYPTPVQYPGQTYPGQTNPGQTYPGQTYPGQTGSNGPSSEIDPSLPLDVSINGATTIERPGTLRVLMRTQPGISCELTIRWPDGSEAPQPTRNADGQGRCEYDLLVGSGAPPGIGLVIGGVRDGGRVSRQSISFQIVTSM
jgi:hypothetical protein